MAHPFDPGPVSEPFASLVQSYPGSETYPADSFRVEWGPIFHRGRLDGSARVLVIGQDPAASEDIVRRILVGEAGHRFQGFLFKLGIDSSYLMINTFLYSVYGQQGGERHANDPAIAAYRHSWLDAIFSANKLDAVIALGSLADAAWQTWRATPSGHGHTPAYAHIIHPTEPESSSGGDRTKLAQAVKAMLANWNQALQQLHPAIRNPDTERPLELYGDAFAPQDRVTIPEQDVPAGLPDWMRSPTAWAQRTGTTAAQKRASITVTIPSGVGVGQ
jgi:uracil-DNA glycosylase